MRILLVEDDLPLAEALTTLLHGAGYALDVTHDGLSAETLIGAERFDLVILDPPSTSTAHGKRWSAGHDYPELVRQALPLVAPGGHLWTITNHRATPLERFARRIAGVLPEGAMLERICPPPLDFPEDGPFLVKTLVWALPGT